MEKIINKYIKKIEVTKNCLDKLNNFIEEKCVNSKVLLIVDFLTIKNNFLKLEEIKKCSLNHIEVFVLKNLDISQIYNIEKILNETYDLIVGIGEFKTIKFVENLAIKNKISYAVVNLFQLKCEIFYNSLNINKYFPPFFVLIEQIVLNDDCLFDLYCNFFKYSFIILENKLQNNLFLSFLNEYRKILNSLDEDNIYKKIIALGLILNKYNINYLTNNFIINNDFNELILANILNICYKNIFTNLNKNNLQFSRVYKNNLQTKLSFSDFNFDFYTFYLLSIKNDIINYCNNFDEVLNVFYNKLKTISIKKYYKLCKKINVNNLYINLVKNLNKNIFLKRMEFFEIFNLN